VKKTRAAFTLLELTITLGIISILVVLLLPALAKMRARAQRVQCMGNLRSLRIAAEQYLQDNNQWPQIRTSSTDTTGSVYAQKWIAALAPYQILPKAWICPTVENLLGNPDYTAAGSERVDYFGMPFDDKPMTPHQWPRQPWFVESADVHGNGQLIIFTDGSIAELKSLIPPK
jgi:prepilin-type N-terminal cleavage/methylation domain-containing protein